MFAYNLDPEFINKVSMPTISEFFGILILMYYSDHAPPYFHARYGEYEALVQIAPIALLKGNLPPRALSLVIEWAQIHLKGCYFFQEVQHRQSQACDWKGNSR
jgi:hypothetical protein